MSKYPLFINHLASVVSFVGRKNSFLAQTNKFTESKKLFHCTSYNLKRVIRRSSIGLNEIDEKGGYGKYVSREEALRDVPRVLKYEMIKMKEELKEMIALDPLHIKPGDRDMVWVFDGTKKSPTSKGYCSHPDNEASPLNPTTSYNTYHDMEESDSQFDGWIASSDKDFMGGLSTSYLTTSPAGHALFTGRINNTLPDDGEIRTLGYANIRCIRPRRSLITRVYGELNTCFDWTAYTHLVIRCRGDGRVYMLNIAQPGMVDLTWNSMFQFPFHTRGGPHWQTHKIPFSRFFFTTKGKIQDKQFAHNSTFTTSLGITLCDKNEGPFKLEIDFIAVEFDPIHTEETAYELYATPDYYSY